MVLWAGGAAAHLRFPKLKAERGIELRLDQEPIRIGYRLGFGATLAKGIRQAADKDGDYTVSAAEGNAALDARSEALLTALRVCTGRSLDALECRSLEQRDIEVVEARGWQPDPSGHLHFLWTLRLRETTGEIGALRLEDSLTTPGVEITDVAIRAPEGVELLRAGPGEGRPQVSTSFTWAEARRPPGPRVVVAAWPPPERVSWLVVAGAVALLVGAGSLLGRKRR